MHMIWHYCQVLQSVCGVIYVYLPRSFCHRLTFWQQVYPAIRDG